jgi:hypothetical protein
MSVALTLGSVTLPAVHFTGACVVKSFPEKASGVGFATQLKLPPS